MRSAGYSLAAISVLVLVAVFLPRRRSIGGMRQGPQRPARSGPDTAMKATVEAFPQAAFVLDAGGTVRYANETAGRLFPATRPGDAFALTFRRPEFAEALEMAGPAEPSSIEFREPGDGDRT